MKSLRKILAVLVATAMVAGMGIMAFAGTITIKSNDNITASTRTFDAYKILEATVSGSGSTATIGYTVPKDMVAFYSDYFRTASGTGEQVAAMQGNSFDKYVYEAIKALNTAEKLQKFGQAVEAYFNGKGYDTQNGQSGTAPSGTIASGSTKKGTSVPSGSNSVIEGLDQGYYLVLDKASPEATGSGTRSAIILDTVSDDNPEIIIKVNYDTPDKKIVGASGSGNNSVKDASGTFQNELEVANATVGSTINFVVTQNVPNWYGYDHFYYIINDTMSEGLTFLPETVKVYIDVDGDNEFEDSINETFHKPLGKTTSGTVEDTEDIPYTTELVPESAYYLYTKDINVARNGNSGTTTDKTFEIAFKDISRFPIGNKIRVEYSARVNSSAKSGTYPDKNSVWLTFSNNPKDSEDQDSGSDKPGVPQNSGTHPIGDGPKDWTDTYTTKIKLHKVDNESNDLNEVQFTLTGTSSEVVIVGQEVYVEDPNGEYWLLKNGKYTSGSPTTKSWMKEAPSGATSGYVKTTAAEEANSGTNKSDWVYVDASGSVPAGSYRPYIVGENGPVYILMLANDGDYESTVVKYSKTSGTETTQGSQPVNVTMVEETAGSGTLVFGQIGEGSYKISETKVPEGFNKAGDFTFDLAFSGSATASEDSQGGEWVVTNAKQGTAGADIAYNPATQTIEITVVNNKGVELPSTGGIGTTIFYAGGAILVLLAGVLLVSKRRFA